ncbi:MAG: ATP-binding cassette domain-containing protein [Verrucomicrobiales bacterium]
MPTPTDADPPNRQAESEAAAGGDAPNPPAAPSPAPRKAARESAMRKLANRIRRRGRRPVPQSMLPTLIKVYAGFSRVEGDVIEGDIDSALGFLRYDYPEAVYSELRELYRQALSQQQDMAKIAKQLSGKLTLEEKILLGVQLYVLISRSSLHREQLIQFYLFMTNLGVASQAIDIVYQLNAGEDLGAEPPEEIEHPLESLSIGKRPPADVVFETLAEGVSLTAFRFSNLILLKNTGTRSFIARSRQVREDEFCRIYDGQRVILGEQVLDYQDLVFYFNAKKNVSSTLLFLAVQSGGGVAIERARTRQSALQIRFGLGVKVRALQDTPLMLRGRSLRAGASVSAGLYDKLVFPGGAEVSLSDLRRRARELGSRFELPTTRSDYMVSNNPSLLREGDILLSPSARGEVLLRIRCDFDQKRGELEVIQSSRPIYVGDAQIKDRVPLEEGATIRLGEGQFLRCHFGERIIEEERNIISQLEVREVSHSYDGKEPALDAVSFAIQRGEMVCVLGPSGCGKSTLLKAIAGHLRPGGGGVHMNGHDLYAHADNLRPYISFIPHDDAFDPLLTVEENLTWSAAIRCPHFGERERRQRVEAKLTELGLRERRDRLAGTSDNKILSGGERKRLNAGMDMISLADVFLFDEPTSGLSSKDSEHVMEIIRGLAHNKIVIVSIHQPSSRLFHMFHKAILLDRGGKLAFFGKPAEMLEYFRAAHDEQSLPAPEPGAPALDSAQPDYVFDVLETPLRDLGGDILYEDDGSGGVAPARRFSPNFWRDRYQTYRLLQDVRRRGIDPARAEDVTAGTKPLPRAPRRSGRDESTLFSTLLKRAFMSKLRNRGNLATTLLEAPLLAALVATVLRYSEEGAYTFASAFHVPTYLFLSLVIGMFLGLTNSADEIIRDRVLLQRERNHRVRISYYIISKFAALSVFAFLQCVIYLLIGNAILELRGILDPRLDAAHRDQRRRHRAVRLQLRLGFEPGCSTSSRSSSSRRSYSAGR